MRANDSPQEQLTGGERRGNRVLGHLNADRICPQGAARRGQQAPVLLAWKSRAVCEQGLGGWGVPPTFLGMVSSDSPPGHSLTSSPLWAPVFLRAFPNIFPWERGESANPRSLPRNELHGGTASPGNQFCCWPFSCQTATTPARGEERLRPVLHRPYTPRTANLSPRTPPQGRASVSRPQDGPEARL